MRADNPIVIGLVAMGVGCATPEAPQQTEPPAPTLPTEPSTPEPTTPPEPEPTPCSQDPEAVRGVDAHMCSPGFVLPLADGTPLDLADLEGQVVLLEFVTMWCGVCRQAAPKLVTYAEERADDPLVVVTVIHEDVFGETPTLDDITAWTKEFGVPHAVVSDVDGELKAAWNRGSTMPTPMAYILDQYGIIRFFAGGDESIDRFDQVVEELLTGG